jgi:L-ribulose-5-phosphate 4-epimerase
MAPPEVLELARAFGDPANDLCILAEGNVSCQGASEALWIKASGVQMGVMTAEDFVEVRKEPLLSALANPKISEEEARTILNDSRVNTNSKHVPSTEAFMHAHLLSLDGVHFVGHGHPPALLSLLVLSDASELATRRWFPDEIVCCGPAACYVPYVAPGLLLAVAIRSAVERYQEKWGSWPKTIWLQNHGLICLGTTGAEVRSAAQMSVKAARVVLEAMQTKSEMRPLSPGQIRQIYDWPDEHYRQRMLRGEH